MSNTQCGFRNVLGTRETLFSIHVPFRRCRETNCGTCACFIDHEKAFDTVQQSKLIYILRETGIDEKGIRIIKKSAGARLQSLDW